MKWVACILLFVPAAICAASEIEPVLSREAEHDVRNRLFYGEYSNTSLMGYRYNSSLTNVYIDYAYSRQDKAVIQQLGSGYMGGDVTVTSYQPIKNGTVWGGASYTRGKIYDVQLNETTDYLLLAPYVMADTVGGSLSTQSYKINGGFNIHLPRKFDIAAEAAYRATIEARQVDPRPKNIVSHLNARIAASYGIKDSMRLAVDVDAAIYKQTNILKFYSEKGSPNVFHPTGLGTRYVRFDGSNCGTYYKGYSVGAGLGLLSTGSGLNLSARYNRFSYTKIISDLNELPMASCVEHTVNADVHYRFERGSGYASVGAEAIYHYRIGNENVFGDATDNIYPLIASIEQFHLHCFGAVVAAQYGFTKGVNTFMVKPAVGYRYFSESYGYPHLYMRFSHITAAVDMQYTLHLPKWYLLFEAAGSYNAPVGSDGADNYLSRGYGRASAKIKASYSWRPDFALYLSAAYTAEFYANNRGGDIYCSMGVLF